MTDSEYYKYVPRRGYAKSDINGFDKLLVIISHVGWLFLGLGFFVIPLFIFLFFDGKNNFIAHHAKQATKAQGLFIAISIIAFLLMFVFVGFFVLPVVLLLAIVWGIASFYACYKALDGEYYSYPFI